MPILHKGRAKDEHLLWWSEAWAQARAPFLAVVIPLANGLQLGSLREWPACLRRCGIVVEGATEVIGMDKDNRWLKRCKETNTVPRNWFLHPHEDLEDKLKELDEQPSGWKRNNTHGSHSCNASMACFRWSYT